MTEPNLSPLFDRINARAYAILQQHGATLEQLQEYDLEQLNEIKGIGDRWATDIRTALDSLQPVPAVTQPPDLETLDADHEDWILADGDESLNADYADGDVPHADDDTPTAIEVELAMTPGDVIYYGAEALRQFEEDLADEPADDEPALNMALRYLRECNREADAEVLAGKVDRDGEAAVVETAIAILDGLPGGALPRNLAQDVRDRAGL